MGQIKKGEKSKQTNIIIYCSYINQIGGIETWIYYMCQRLHKYYNITLLFDDSFMNQLYRLANFVNIEHRDIYKKYECDVLLMASNWKPVPSNVKYKRIIQTVHSDYEYIRDNMHFTFNIPRDAEVITVSPRTQEALKTVNKCNSKVIYNILGEKQEVKKVLHLVTFSRMTVEKGFNRICALTNILKDKDIKFDWKIFATIDDKQKSKISCPEVIFMPPTLDVYDYIVDADYLVQLSDTEAFCYSVHEALQYGTPVIVTDIPVFQEFIIDGKNGYLLDLDMKNAKSKIDDIINKIPKIIDYHEPCDINEWFSVLGEPVELLDTETNNKLNNENVEVVAIETYHDRLLDRQIRSGEKYYVNKVRAYELTTRNNNSKTILARYV